MTRRPTGRKKSADEDDGYVGRRVRMRRLELGLSLTGVAKRIGVTHQQLLHYERGAQCISVSRLQQIADVLRVPAPFFFEGIPQSDTPPIANAAGPSLDPGSDYVSAFLATSDGLALINALTQITDAGLRRQIIRLVERIAKDRRE